MLYLDSELEYREYYTQLSRKPIISSYGFPVYFPRGQFYHAFFKTVERELKTDEFDFSRAELMDEIVPALSGEHPQCEWKLGWDRYKGVHTRDRVVCLIYRQNVIVIRLSRDKHTGEVQKGSFHTIYPLEPSSRKMVLNGPAWSGK